MEKNKLKFLIYTDGGSRGNPGPAAIGVVISAEGGSASGGEDTGWKKNYEEYIGKATNNEAEYRAVIFALKKLKSLIGGEKIKKSLVEICMDSELLVKQLNGKYKIKEKNIQNLFLEAWNLRLDFGEIIFRHIPRDDNYDADKLVNQALNKEESKLDI